MILPISICKFDAKTPPMHLNTSPTCFEGSRGRRTEFRDPGPEIRVQVLLNYVHHQWFTNSCANVFWECSFLKFSKARVRAPGPQNDVGPGPWCGPCTVLEARGPDSGPGKTLKTKYLNYISTFIGKPSMYQ